MKIKVRFDENSRALKTKFGKSKQQFATNLGELHHVTKVIGGEVYGGDYIVTPKVDSQTMPTQGKVMMEDVTVKAIPYFDVTNNSGGSTVYIAKEI